jgi:hypothetical protein
VNTQETAEIRGLGDKLDSYHVELSTFVARQEERCKSCSEKVARHELDINGATPPDEYAPSLKESVRSLLQSRRALIRKLGYLWAALAAIAGAVSWPGVLAFFRGGKPS